MRVTLESGRAVDINVRRKHIKNLILRIYPDGNVALSAPFSMPQKELAAFVNARKKWLENHLEKQDQMPQLRADRVRLLGQDYFYKVEESGKNRVFVDEDTVTVYAKEPSAARDVLDKWWRREAYEYFMSYVDKWMPLLSGLGAPAPRVSVRRMKSIWGSCTSKKATIRLNYYLFSAPPQCVEYVVLHELGHLLYPNHGERFKAFLTRHMPDWKQRKKLLGYERTEHRHE